MATCQVGQMTYIHSARGYTIFAALAHEQQGKCCVSGCPHCLYHHINVRDKATKIQQPAFLYLPPNSEPDLIFTPLSQACRDVCKFF